MNMLNRKSSRLAPVDDNTDIIAALHRRIVEMQDDDKADVERQMRLRGRRGPRERRAPPPI
jgi:hypothetical protein